MSASRNSKHSAHSNAPQESGRESNNNNNVASRNSNNGRESNQSLNAAQQSGRQSSQSNAPPASGRQSNNNNNGRQSNQSLKAAQESGRQSSQTNFSIDDHPQVYPTTNRSDLSSHDRELINKSRNGYLDTKYISDVKQYFEYSSFDNHVTEKNKKYLEDLLSDFRKLLQSTLGSENDKLHDVEFFEESTSRNGLSGHQQLLTARSATFEALFKNLDNGEKEYLGFKLLGTSPDGRIKCILLPQDEPKISKDCMEAALHYMYWGNIDESFTSNEEKLKRFFEAASFLDLKELRRYLAGELHSIVVRNGNPTLAINYLKLSVKCGCKYLKRKLIDYIVENKKAVIHHESWKQFINEKESKELVKEIYQSMVQNDAVQN